MKIIIPLINQYQIQQNIHNNTEVSIIEKLKTQVQESKKTLNKLREIVRVKKFKNRDHEIHFFKNIKPGIHADYIFYNSQLKYQVSKPNTTNSILKNYLKNELKKLESKKRKNLDFYRYYKHKSKFLDQVYFLRENKQLELFSTDISIYLDSEFYTSHDTLAAEVITYDLITDFYKKEIKKLKNITSCILNDSKNKTKSNLDWTASKTDLVELVYALKVSGAINSGHINTKELIELFSNTFNIDILNYYKTYSEIKNRSTERTKFLNKLLDNFQAKLEYDDGI
jgi:hypothetical protein